jgi:hypothetical protein
MLMGKFPLPHGRRVEVEFAENFSVRFTAQVSRRRLPGTSAIRRGDCVGVDEVVREAKIGVAYDHSQPQ